MSSNLTPAGWLVLLGAIAVLAVGWWLMKIVYGLPLNATHYFVGGGVGLLSGGAVLLETAGMSIIKR